MKTIFTITISMLYALVSLTLTASILIGLSVLGHMAWDTMKSEAIPAMTSCSYLSSLGDCVKIAT